MLQIQIDSKSLIDQLSVCIAKQVIRALELLKVFFNEKFEMGIWIRVLAHIRSRRNIPAFLIQRN